MAIVLSEGRAPALRRLMWPVRWLHRMVIRWQISETELWVRACEADGLDLSLSRPDILDQLAALRVKLALLEE